MNNNKMLITISNALLKTIAPDSRIWPLHSMQLHHNIAGKKLLQDERNQSACIFLQV
jgi:hypothetical protein